MLISSFSGRIGIINYYHHDHYHHHQLQVLSLTPPPLLTCLNLSARRQTAFVQNPKSDHPELTFLLQLF